MKKIILAAAALVLSTAAVSAQKATPWFIGGSASVYGEKYGDDKEGAISINPEVGYMFNDNWGIALDLGFAMEKGLEGDNYKNTRFGAGISGLYVMKITDKFFYTPTVRVGFDSGKDKYDDTTLYEDTNINGRLEFLKFEFRPSCHWGLNVAFGSADLNINKVKDADDSTLTGNLGLDRTRVGFKYYF